MGSPFSGYHVLMRRRIKDVLLVASPYDSFILEQDGRFSDQVFARFLELNLGDSPHFMQVTTGREALKTLKHQHYDLVLTTSNARDMSPRKLAAAVRKRHPDLPVALLTYDRAEARAYAQLPREELAEVFLWTGDPGVLLAIVKSVEDRLNVRDDTRKGGVRVILVVEDSPDFSSAFLPIIYSEVLKQTQHLLADVLNEADRLYRQRARPKILLARNFEEAGALIRRYREYLLGMITDLRFPRAGKVDERAGIRLIQRVRKGMPDLPILLQSSELDSALADQLDVAIANKGSPELLRTLRTFLYRYLGFGPFIFRTPDGRQVGRAPDLSAMLRALPGLPADSIRYHAEHNHFSNWLMARGEFPLADQLRPQRTSDFGDLEEIRGYLIHELRRFLDQRQRGLVTNYRQGADPLRQRDFTRVGDGSMGGKSRGIAFLAATLADHPIHAAFPQVDITVPRTVVLCTAVYEAFCEAGDLFRRALELDDDDDVARLFQSQALTPSLVADLAAILTDVTCPLAVRSSSLLEDSAHEPLAGIYESVLLPNRGTVAERLSQLTAAIRYVFASTLFQGPRTYLAAVGHRLEEERMAVVIQRLVGREHGERFYPDFAGVVQSHNFYPIRYQQIEDGVATVALGLGYQVVEGGKAYRFSPRHPEIVPQMSSSQDILRCSQRRFTAVDLAPRRSDGPLDVRAFIEHYQLADAEADGTLAAVGATYVAADDRVRDTIHTPGVRVVTFAPVLKHGLFPLAEILSELIEIGVEGMGGPVEMEFAVCLGERPELSVVQIRPQLMDTDIAEPVKALASAEETVIALGPALGNGRTVGIHDVVYVHPRRLDQAWTRAAARTITTLNATLTSAGHPYALIGPGRLGTSDPWLGVPVTWPQVSGAKVVVELAVPGQPIDPSQGTHFFQNITGLRLACFTIDPADADQHLDLSWFDDLPAEFERDGVRHVRLPSPLEVRVDGRNRIGIIVCSEP